MIQKIYLAGGCFWGVEGYFQKIIGITNTQVGYANGRTEETSYENLNVTDHAETVQLDYDISKISLEEILLHFFRIIDPTTENRQGNDIGRQYRTAIFYTEEKDLAIIEKIMHYEHSLYPVLAVRVEPLRHFIPAEEYHQRYLQKNPLGYCHIPLALADRPLFSEEYSSFTQSQIQEKLDPLAYEVMRHEKTERPFTSPLNNEYRKGIYVDRITGEPLFSSDDKFDAGCGWPSFSRPILTDRLQERTDTSHGMIRTEVRTKNSNSHLGHVFSDGPQEKGGLRYCINGAALEFIPYEEMEERGYEKYMIFCH